MRTYSTACQAALDAGQVTRAGAVKVAYTGDTFLGWGGNGVITLGGEVYVGLGDRFLATVFQGQLGSNEIGATISLSGIDPDVAAGIDLVAARGAEVVVWELLFDISGRTLLDATPALLGTADQLTLTETPGGTSTLALAVEGASRGLGKSSGRMSTDADQRLIKADDGSLKNISYAGTITLYWGGQKPATAAQALPNTGSLASSIGVGNVAARISQL